MNKDNQPPPTGESSSHKGPDSHHEPAPHKKESAPLKESFPPKVATRQDKARQALLLFVGIIVVCLVLAIIAIVLGSKDSHLKSQLAASQQQLNQAKTDNTQAQSDLTTAKAQAADLQTQLDKSKTQTSDMQAQLELAKEAQNDLQSQMDREKAQAADLQSQVGKATAHAKDLQADLNQSNAGSTQLLTQLDQAKIQSMDLQSRLETAEHNVAQLQPMLLKARHMPVTTTQEKKGFWGGGITLDVTNLYPQPLSVAINITGAKPRSQTNIIGGNDTLKVGNLASGDTVVITSDGYESLNVAVQ